MTFATPYPGPSPRGRPASPPGPPPPDLFTPERLARERAAERPAPAAPTPAPAPPPAVSPGLARLAPHDDPLGGLEALNLRPRRRPLLPPPDTLDEYDSTLVAMLRAVAVAENESVGDALAAQGARYGGGGWQAALEATADTLYAHLDGHADPDGATLPPLPPAASTALRRHITEDAPGLLVAAYLSQTRVLWADRRVRDHARRAEQTHERVRQNRDDIEAQIAARWEGARNSRDRSEYEGGKRLSPQWAQANALLRWLDNPDRAYTPPRPNVYPADLEYLEYQADMATGGLERTIPPLPPADKQALRPPLRRRQAMTARTVALVAVIPWGVESNAEPGVTYRPGDITPLARPVTLTASGDDRKQVLLGGITRGTPAADGYRLEVVVHRDRPAGADLLAAIARPRVRPLPLAPHPRAATRRRVDMRRRNLAPRTTTPGRANTPGARRRPNARTSTPRRRAMVGHPARPATA